jgi:hypothetical protein
LSTIFADSAISGGPADMARTIFASVVSVSTIIAVGFDSERVANMAPVTAKTAIVAKTAVCRAFRRLIVSSLPDASELLARG